MSGMVYATPLAFRRALTDRLKVLAANGPWTVTQLQRQTAYDRFLERLYALDDAWVVKGATALLAREIGSRGTLDIDLYLERAPRAAESHLREAVGRDIGDWFRFEVGLARPVAVVTGGVRLPVTAYVGNTPWANFHIDLVGTDVRMTGAPDDVPPLVQLSMPSVEQHGYRAYPLVDHVADKVVATFQRYGAAQVGSTRYKDLVDLVAISGAAIIDADQQLTALRSEAERRHVQLPGTFQVGNSVLWTTGYATAANEARLKDAPTLNAALDAVRPFVDPLLAGTATGQWSPQTQRWRDRGKE